MRFIYFFASWSTIAAMINKDFKQTYSFAIGKFLYNTSHRQLILTFHAYLSFLKLLSIKILHHKVHRFSSGTDSPGWSRKKGRKTVVVWWVYKMMNISGSSNPTAFCFSIL